MLINKYILILALFFCGFQLQAQNHFLKFLVLPGGFTYDYRNYTYFRPYEPPDDYVPEPLPDSKFTFMPRVVFEVGYRF